MDEIQSSQLKLESIQTDTCAICFKQDDSEESKDMVDWISCNKCSMWVHLNCIVCENEDEYVCPYCDAY